MNSKLILLIGAGVVVYVWWESQKANATGASSLPSDAVPMLAQGTQTPLSLQAGQSGTVGSQTLSGPGYVYYSPSTKLFYVSATAPSAAQIAAAVSLTSAPSSTGTTPPQNTTTTTPPATTSTYKTPAGATVSSPTTLAGIWAAIQQWAAADPNFTTSGGVLSGLPDHWNFYLAYISPTAPAGYTGAWPPDLNAVFPGIDVTQPMTATAFWAGMGAYLSKGGLSGLAGMGGLGDAGNRFRYRGPGGYAA